MPMIVHYLDRRPEGRIYDAAELAELQQIYDRAREVLGIDVTDPRRGTLAILVFQVWDYTRGVDDALDAVLAKFK